MNADAVVRQLRPNQTGVGTALPSRPEQQPIALGPEISVVRDWPKRTALLIGGASHPLILGALQSYGLVSVPATTDQTDRIASAGPFTFLFVGPESLVDDASTAQVRIVQSSSPSARLLLAYSAAPRDPDVLIRGLHAGMHDVFDPEDPGAVNEVVLRGLLNASAHRERVLAIGAHPDDVEIGCGGTLIDHYLRGDRLSILTLSRGAVGGDQEDRLEEASNTAAAVGAQLLFGDLPDTRIDDGIATIRLIEEVVRAVDPTVVYVHSKHDSHQDHRAVSTATASATRGVRRIFSYQSPSATNEFRPTRFVPVDDVLRQKVEVLLMFNSQNGRSYLEPELVVAGSRYWARHLGANARYAEPFEVMRSIGDLRTGENARALSADIRPGFDTRGPRPAPTLISLHSGTSAQGVSP